MKNRLLTIALVLVLGMTLLPVGVQADDSALVKSSEYWTELTFSQANQMVDAAKNGTGDSFLLFFYNRSCRVCMGSIPILYRYANDTRTAVFGLDALNTLGGADRAFYHKENKAYPLLYIYKADTKELTVDGDMSSINKLTQALDRAGIVIAEPWTCPYTDVRSSDWFYEDIEFVHKEGLMKGLSETIFAPGDTLDRAMLATVLHRMGGGPAVTYKPTFADVPEGEWYSDAVIWASDNGIVEGYGGGTFGPRDNITREQMATMLHRFANHMGYDLSGPAELPNFSDAHSISDWAQGAMKWCVAAGYIKGRDNATLDPRSTATRAECAAILRRFAAAPVPPSPLPPARLGSDNIDVNINMDTIDNWLGRDDVVYRDVRMLIDDADFDVLGGSAATVLKWTIKGFKIVSWPYIANPSALPSAVGEGYTGKTLFTVTRDAAGGITSAKANYAESVMILEELFPKDKAVFLLCGGAGYSREIRDLLISLGWDASRLYVIGRGWDYQGENTLPLFLSVKGEGGKDIDILATWRADYAIFNFERLTPITSGSATLRGTYFAPPAPAGSHTPLPPAQDTIAGTDRNIHMGTIDSWLGRDDVVYRDLRMLFDPAEFETIGGLSDLSHTINGFKVVSFPYVANSDTLTVPGAYGGSSLFSVTWDPDRVGTISDVQVNYEEAMMILEELFPKDKAIFLMSGWNGYAGNMKALLHRYGWDASKIYIVGSAWDYKGANSLELTVPPAGGNNTVYATWRADYAVINFYFLNPFSYYDGTPPAAIDPNNPSCSVIW